MKKRTLVSRIELFKKHHPRISFVLYTLAWMIMLFLAWDVYGDALSHLTGWSSLYSRATCAFFVIVTSYAVEFVKN